MDATDSLATQDILRAELARQTEHLEARIDVSIERLRAEMWRAMYLQVGVMAALTTTIAGIALALAKWGL